MPSIESIFDYLGGGTRKQFPFMAFGRQRLSARDTYDHLYRQCLRLRCDEFEDFNGDLSTTDLAVVGNLYDLSPAGTPTQALVADAPHGQLKQLLTNDNQISWIGYYGGDQRTIACNGYPFFETRLGFKTLPAANERYWVGLASDIAGGGTALDAVTYSINFRLEANGVLLAEVDDGTNDRDDQSTGQTLVAGTWYTLSAFMEPNGWAAYYLSDKYGANGQRVAYLNASAMKDVTDTMQFASFLMKDSGTGVPDVRLDYWRTSWHRVDSAIS